MHNELKLYKTSKALNLFLARLFPNITNLLITKEQFGGKDNELINIWPATSLVLVIKNIYSYNGEKFYKTINEATNLRQLNIFAIEYELGNAVKTIWPLPWLPLAPTLARLEGFGLLVSNS